MIRKYGIVMTLWLCALVGSSVGVVLACRIPLDWFWLIGYLAQKVTTAAIAGDVEKAKHHAISTAAALANWHLRLSE